MQQTQSQSQIQQQTATSSSTHLSSYSSDSKFVSQKQNQQTLSLSLTQTTTMLLPMSVRHKQQLKQQPEMEQTKQQLILQQQPASNMASLSDAEMICKSNYNRNVKRHKNNNTNNNNNNGNTAYNMLHSSKHRADMSRCHCRRCFLSSQSKPHRRAGVHKIHYYKDSNNENNNNNSNKKTDSFYKQNKLPHWIFFTTLILCAFGDVGEAALLNVNLLVEPPAVRRGQSVALRCDYSLDGAPLYSIKFYRGQLEFYRYMPGEYPSTKVFQYPGIKVDESTSNATQVIIRNVSFGLSGNFSCEVTADAPLYSTATAYAQMQVVEFPEKRPQLFTEQTRYEPGDVLRANCSTPPSRPRAELRFTINGVPVTSEETQYIRTVDNLIASRLSLKLQLQAVHFVAAVGANAHMMNALGNGAGGTSGNGGSGAGGLILRCTAQIGDLYQEYKEIELGTPQKDPVPARVTLSSGSGFRNFIETYFTKSSATRLANSNNNNKYGTIWQLITLISLSGIVVANGSFQK